jgi:hypothetical protein
MAGSERIPVAPDEVKRTIDDFKSSKDKLYEAAGGIILKWSEDIGGLNALMTMGFQLTCENMVDDVSDSRKDIVFTCLSRIACRQFTENTGKKSAWDEGTLTTHLAALSTSQRTREKEKKNLKILKAMRWFVLCGNSVQFEGGPLSPHQIAEKLGWVGIALSCETSNCGPAILMLDALADLPSLPGAMIKETDESVAVLKHVISSGSELEKVAGMCVASRVITSLAQGGADVPLSPGADNWLRKLREAGIVREVVDCTKDCRRRTFVEAAVCTLKDLSWYGMFLEDFAADEVMRVLVDNILTVELYHTSVCVLLRRVLTLQTAADAFTTRKGYSACLKILTDAGVGHDVFKELASVLLVWLNHAASPDVVVAFTSKHGFTRCLSLLLGRELEEAKPILALLVAWCAVGEDTVRALKNPYGPVDLTILVELLTKKDQVVVEGACTLVSWALDSKYQGWEGLVEQLEGGAVVNLLLFYLRCRNAVPYALLALERLIAGGDLNGAIKGRFGYVLAVHDLLVLLRENCDEALREEALAGLRMVADGGEVVIEYLVDHGAVDALVDSLQPEDGPVGPARPNVLRMMAVRDFLQVIDLERVAEVVPAMVKSLLKVKPPWRVPAVMSNHLSFVLMLPGSGHCRSYSSH